MDSYAPEMEEGLIVEPLFVGVTRPAMAWGVTYSAILVNGLVTIETFLFTKNLLWLLIALPIHGVLWLVCLAEPRFFDLFLAWGQTRGRGLLGNARYWKANSYSPLRLDLPDSGGARRGSSWVRGGRR